MSEEGDDDSQKTEEPTARRLEEARKKGQVPMSREVGSWLLLFTGTLIATGYGPTLLSDLQRFLVVFISESWQIHTDKGLGHVLGQTTLTAMKIMAVPFAVFVLAAIAGPFGQIGPMISPDVLRPDLDKLSPMKGFARVFSFRSVTEFLKGLFKIAIVSAVAYAILKPYFGKMEMMVGLSIPALLFQMKDMLIRVMSGILAVFFIIVVADILYQRLSFLKQMRMSRQELKDEFKQTEGDPYIKARLKNLRMEKARKRMMTAVPKSTVVITNPTHYAVALRYDQGADEAPVVVAKGTDFIAKKIREVAEQNNVVIVENPPLARTLFSTVEIDETIKPEQYKAVAEVISFVFRLKGQLKK